MASSGSGARGRGSPCGSRAGAGGRGRHHDVILDDDLASLPAMDLMAHLHRHRTSQYLFVGVSMVFHERERRLAEAQDRARETDVVVDGLRAELSASADTVEEWRRKVVDAEAVGEIWERELSAAKARFQAEVEEWRRKVVQAEDGLRGEIRAREATEAWLRAEVEDWRRKAQAVADDLRGEVGRARDELSAAKAAEARVQAEVEEWRRKVLEAEAVADGLRGEIRRAHEQSAAAAKATEARLRAEVEDWRRKAVEAVAVVDGLRGVRAEIRDRELSAAAEKAETRRAAADAEARLRAEMEEWRRRAVEAEARLLPVPAKRGSQASEVHGNVPRASSVTVRRAPSPPAPALGERNLMDETEVIDISSDDEYDQLVEEGRRGEASSKVVSRKRKKKSLALGKDAAGDVSVNRMLHKKH